MICAKDEMPTRSPKRSAKKTAISQTNFEDLMRSINLPVIAANVFHCITTQYSQCKGIPNNVVLASLHIGEGFCL